MSLRQSPTRTPAFLAAVRANARKSTGPRTPAGKLRIALNGVRHGMQSHKVFARLVEAGLLGSIAQYSRPAREFFRIYEVLDAAMLPETAKQMNLVTRTAAHVWTVKRDIDRWIASPPKVEAYFKQTGGWFPRPWRLRLEPPGWPEWKVTISVWVRRGRERTGRRVRYLRYGWQPGGAKLHAVVTVTASGHPLLGCCTLWASGATARERAQQVVPRTMPDTPARQARSVREDLRGVPADTISVPPATVGPEGSAHDAR